MLCVVCCVLCVVCRLYRELGHGTREGSSNSFVLVGRVGVVFSYCWYMKHAFVYGVMSIVYNKGKTPTH